MPENAPTAPPAPRRLPVVRQLEIGDCGAACLATVLRAHGCDVELGDLRDLTSTGRDGVTAAGMLAAARHFGFEGQGVRCPPERLAELPRGAVLHWNRNHFVVLDGHARNGLRIVDPALGTRVVPPETVRTAYSGVALLLTPPAGLPRAAARRRQGPRRRFAPYRPFVGGNGRLVVFALLCAAAVQVLALAHPIALRMVVDRLTARGADPELAGGLALGVGALAVGYLLASGGRLLFLVALQRAVDFRLTVGVLAHLVRLPYAFLARRSAGDIALRLRSTVVVRQILTSGALSTVLDGALVLLYLVVILTIDPWFAGLTLAAVGGQVLVVAVSWPRLRRASAEALEAQTASQAELVEIVNGLEVLKVSGAADHAVAAWSARLRKEVDAQAYRNGLDGVVDGILLTIRFAAPPALLALGLSRVASGALSLGDMLALAALSAAVTVPTGALLSTVCSFSTVASYLERLDDLLRSRPEEGGGEPLGDRLAGGIRLAGVSYAYSPLLPPAVADVDLEIRAGEHVAIVGASGSGKSTLAMLIAVLYEPTAGTVYVDGVDARSYDVVELRRRMGIVTQDTTLFSRSVRDNLTLGRDGVPDEEVVRAARLAAIHDDIAALPSGYDTVLGDGGTGLSGGQRQRLALARALVAEPGLLVLDEATSALDSVTESAVLEALATLDCTRVVIAHRLSTVARADRVVVLDEGRVVANGTYAQVRRRSAVFRALTAADTALAAPARTAPRKRTGRGAGA